MKKTSSLALALGGIALAGWATSRALAAKFSFAGKIVLITGGSRGLGFTIGRQIVAEGGKVVLIARDRDELQRAHDEIAAAGGDVFIIPCDLLDTQQIKDTIETVVSHFDRIDVLINNAGIIEVGPLEHMSREDFERAMQLHLWAPYTLMTEVIPWMQRQRGGRIVNISSIGGKIAVPHLAPYSASKFALTGLSDSFRSELARENIYVTTVCPGLMRTGSHVNAQFKGKHEQEFAWFALALGVPVLSMSVDRAAAKIIDACRRGQPALTLTLPAKLAIAANGLFPNLVGYANNLTNRLLPGATDSSGDELRSGRHSRSQKLSPHWLTRLADRAIPRTNQPRGTATP